MITKEFLDALGERYQVYDNVESGSLMKQLMDEREIRRWFDDDATRFGGCIVLWRMYFHTYLFWFGFLFTVLKLYYIDDLRFL